MSNKVAPAPAFVPAPVPVFVPAHVFAPAMGVPAATFFHTPQQLAASTVSAQVTLPPHQQPVVLTLNVEVATAPRPPRAKHSKRSRAGVIAHGICIGTCVGMTGISIGLIWVIPAVGISMAVTFGLSSFVMCVAECLL